jgi:DNA mismatch endonuclease (patch repair protein)
MQAVRGKGNKTTEQRFRASLIRAGIKGWKLHPKGFLGNPDFVFTESMLAVFVDGCFWHGCRRCGHIPKTNREFWAEKVDRNRSRDKRNTSKLRRHGFTVLRFWEHDLADLPHCIDRIYSALVHTVA